MTATARQKGYVLDGSRADLQRLWTLAQKTEGAARDACARVGVHEGWAAIDCGCGPIGALPVLSQLVGATGRVVGIDLSEAAVETARSMIADHNLRNVEVVCGDVNAMAGDQLAAGQFDLAFTRCFLMHQPDPVHTLERIALMLRPGGWIVAQEPLRTPSPRSSPPCEALPAYWELLHQVIEATGVPRDSIAKLPVSARAAGLEIVTRHGFFTPAESAVGFELHAGTLGASSARIVSSGVASEARVGQLLAQLGDAGRAGHDWASTPFFADFALRKPAQEGVRKTV